MDEKLVISKKLKGDDGYKTFSVRLPQETVERLDQLAAETHRSRNDLIKVLLNYALDHSVAEENRDT
ncbi:MAG: CopG family transcriptional regulator [Clostridia bacterium]|nr:CopG family transcriptional regulator [Clostridia bacterium]